MGRFSTLVSGIPGYFRERAEDEFPWDYTGKGVWYALVVVESGRIERYGFTSSKANKASLRGILQSLGPADEVVLLGVWTGKFNTHLFVLDRTIALQKLTTVQTG